MSYFGMPLYEIWALRSEGIKKSHSYTYRYARGAILSLVFLYFTSQVLCYHMYKKFIKNGIASIHYTRRPSWFKYKEWPIHVLCLAIWSHFQYIYIGTKTYKDIIRIVASPFRKLFRTLIDFPYVNLGWLYVYIILQKGYETAIYGMAKKP